MYIDDFVRVKRPLTYWRELLLEWVFLVHRVYRISKGNTSAHAEKERANTGLLAAAATRNGWIALEECRTSKAGKYVRSETYSGRCDLVLWRDRRNHEIEAKFARVFIPMRSKNRVEKFYRKAMDDSSRSTRSGRKSEKMIGITYIVPIIRPAVYERVTNEYIAEELGKLMAFIKSEFNPALLSCAFPGPVTLEGSPNYGLGVILIGDVT